MRRALVILLCLSAMVTAGGASATQATIYPGVGIGKVRLGMNRAQVTHVLGRDYIVNGHSGTAVDLAWNFGSWTVTLAQNRVVQVAVTVRGQKTLQGIGPGASWRQLVKAYPGGRCTKIAQPNSQVWNEYLVANAGGTQTIYLGSAVNFFYEGKQNNHPWRITEVHVRSPYVRLPEFASSWPDKCRSDWRTADNP